MNETTPYGFKWGNVTVQRMAEIKGYHVLAILVNDEYRLEIVVSPKGKNVRVTDHLRPVREAGGSHGD